MKLRTQLFPVLRRRPLAVFLTTVLAAAGGAAANYLNWPLAWMLGALAVVVPAALAGVKVAMDAHVRIVMVYIIGVMIGSAFGPHILGSVVTWAPTLLGLAGYVVVGTVMSGIYFVRVARFERHTAFFAAFPGGLTQMAIIGGAMGADERAIALSHAVRIVLVVAGVPLFFSIGMNVHRPEVPHISIVDLHAFDGLIMVASALLGAALGHFSRIPAGYMIGPMIVSAAFHLTGVSAARPSDELVAAAQIILGASIGCRFYGAKVMTMLRTAAHSVVAAIILLAVTAVFVIALNPLTPVGIEALVLAYSPGGLTEMSLIALALGVDLAFVSSHHVVRIVLIMLIGPLFGRLYAARAGQKPDPRP
ncbi:MAG: AbrB family transcriptional regulator [Alphaproteobacteria bacterium]